MSVVRDPLEVSTSSFERTVGGSTDVRAFGAAAAAPAGFPQAAGRYRSPMHITGTGNGSATTGGPLRMLESERTGRSMPDSVSLNTASCEASKYSPTDDSLSDDSSRGAVVKADEEQLDG